MEVIAHPMVPVEESESIRDKLLSDLDDAGIDEREVLVKARENMVLWDGYFGENIVRGRDDMKFLVRDMWSAVERSEFSRTFVPAMTFNKLYDPVKKILAEQRKNKPDLMVRSLTGRANEKQIDIRADLVRTISYQSQNDLVYQTAFRSALMMGFGAFEIVLDYEPNSFNQVIRYELIPDTSRVSFDPVALKPHKGDGDFCARQFLYGKPEFFATFPGVINPVSYTDPRSLLDFQWETRDTIVVCKYTQKEWFPVKLLLLTNGQTVTEYEWFEMQREIEMQRSLADSSQIVGDMIRRGIPEIHGERMEKDYKIRQYLLTQNEIIKFTDWPSKYLPQVFVDGDSNYVNGQQYTRSFIHEARDAQKFVNYVGSEITAEIKNRRREQWLGTPDNIVGNEQMWRNPELQMGILTAKPDPKTGQMPQKMPAWEISQGLFQQFQRGCQDIREILGFSENEALQGHDMSGKARRERKMEGSMSAGVWFSNLNQAIEQGGRIVLDLLPVIAGEHERPFIVSKPDGRTESIVLNKIIGQNEEGEPERENVLDDDEYDIEIDTGPSFAVQKEVALEFFQQTLQAAPQTFPLVADLWAKNLDVQYMPQIAERFKTLVPPKIIAEEEGKELPPAPPNPQEQLMQMELQSKIAEIKNKQEKLELERQQHELDKADLLLKAQKVELDSQLDIYNHQASLEKTRLAHGLDKEKAESKFSTDLAKILADLHKHANPHKKEEKQTDNGT